MKAKRVLSDKQIFRMVARRHYKMASVHELMALSYDSLEAGKWQKSSNRMLRFGDRELRKLSDEINHLFLNGNL